MSLRLNGKPPTPTPVRRPSRMTLQEYLESNNLKRRIRDHSKSKDSKKQSVSVANAKDPGINQSNILDYLALNQEWKSRKTFSAWIQSLKELCRAYIANDSEYIEVSRKIEQISEFVKTEIDEKRKENLILQSYMVSQASYWQESQIGRTKILENPTVQACDTNFEFNSPDGKTRNEQNKVQKRLNPQSRSTNSQVYSRAASEPKRPQHESDIVRTYEKSSTNAKEGSTKQLGAHFYSFKDNYFEEKRGSSSNKDAENMNLLKLENRSSNEEVPRLSLMSRFDQNKARNEKILSGGSRENESVPLIKQKPDEECKPSAPLRQRRQKAMLSRPPDTLNFLYKDQSISKQVEKTKDNLIQSIESPLIKSKNNEQRNTQSQLSNQSVTLQTPSTFNRKEALWVDNESSPCNKISINTTAFQLEYILPENHKKSSKIDRYQKYKQNSIREATQQDIDQK